MTIVIKVTYECHSMFIFSQAPPPAIESKANEPTKKVTSKKLERPGNI